MSLLDVKRLEPHPGSSFSDTIDLKTSTFPPSPPVSPRPFKTSTVARLADRLQQRFQGISSGADCEWEQHTLTQDEYGQLEKKLEERGLLGWYDDKVRYDFDPYSRLYALRMASATHEVFTHAVMAEIERQLKDSAKELKSLHSELGHLVEGLLNHGNTSLRLFPDTDSGTPVSSQGSDDLSKLRNVIQKPIIRSPDGQLGLDTDGMPTFVLETSYSQRQRALPALADSYICDSEHEIRCVVGLDIEYLTSRQIRKGDEAGKSASVSHWRPAIEQNPETGKDVGVSRAILEEATFRSSNGQVVDGSLTLTLEDFLPADVCDAHKDSVDLSLPQVVISHAFLADSLGKAEFAQQSRQARQRKAKSERKMRFRKRKASPEEELSDGQENKIRKLEEEADTRHMGLDGAWEPGGASQARDEIGAVPLRRSTRKKSSEG